MLVCEPSLLRSVRARMSRQQNPWQRPGALHGGGGALHGSMPGPGTGTHSGADAQLHERLLREQEEADAAVALMLRSTARARIVSGSGSGDNGASESGPSLCRPMDMMHSLRITLAGLRDLFCHPFSAFLRLQCDARVRPAPG